MGRSDSPVSSLWFGSRQSPPPTAPRAPPSIFEFRGTAITADLRLPLSELAFSEPLLAAPAESVARHRAALSAYVLWHFALRVTGGAALRASVAGLSVALDKKIPDLVVRLTFASPPGAPPRALTLESDLIVHEIINHRAFVWVRADSAAAVPLAEPAFVGAIHFQKNRLALDRPPRAG